MDLLTRVMEAVSLIRLISRFLPSTQRCVAAVLALSALLPLGVSAQRLLDLTADVPDSGSPGVPGASFESLNKPTPLALEVVVQDLVPVVAAKGDRITVQVLIRNTGKYAIEIPSSRDRGRIFESRSFGRKELSMGLSVSPVGLGKTFHFSLEGSVGASNIPGSFIVLSPGDSLVVRSRGDLVDIVSADGSGASIGDADVSVVVSENVFEDGRYAINGSSGRVISSNSFKVYWPIQIHQRPTSVTPPRQEQP